MKTVVVLLLSVVIGSINTHAQPIQNKVIVYSDEFQGNSLDLAPGQYDNLTLIRGGVITVKSVRVPKGMKATLYSHDQFQGQALSLTEDANTSFLESKGYAQAILSVSIVVEQIAQEPLVVTGPAITIFRDDFSGPSAALPPGRYEFNELGNVGNDQLSSIKIPDGLKVTLYEHSGFKGKSLVLTKDTRAAIIVRSRFNDLTSSILVESVAPAQPPVVTVVPTQATTTTAPTSTQPVTIAVAEPPQPIIYAGDFSGESKAIDAGHFSSDQLGIGNNELSSIRVPKGYRVTLYDGDAFEGRSLVLVGDARAANLVQSGFNNVTSSLLVEKVALAAVFEGEFNGASVGLLPGRYSGKEMGIMNDQLSSVRVPPGLRVTLFENEGFWGRSLILNEDANTETLNRSAFNDLTSSILVELVETASPATPARPSRPMRNAAAGMREQASNPASPASQPVVVDPGASASPQPAEPPACVMNPTQFQSALTAIKSRISDRDKMDMAILATRERCLSLTQVRDISGVFINEDVKLDFVKHAYNLSTEKADYYQLQNLFKFMSTQDAFIQFLKGK